jgi:hypothetical protein
MTAHELRARIDLYERLMRLDKPIGILLLLWPTLWALWLSSNGSPNWIILWIFVLGTVLMRSAGCVINDFADRDIDPRVKRTRLRPLAARRVSPYEALALFVVLVLLAAMADPRPRRLLQGVPQQPLLRTGDLRRDCLRSATHWDLTAGGRSECHDRPPRRAQRSNWSDR